ncbi:hypothetical protein K435DRAFT_663012 [Dendrothele bispora CBS 962.96]|uniref:Type 1 phosphatases regulator n=1 Tax=Dendrothele bispora (strain CBS 962.96) TaxID=1314807 RepID=A0A4S8M596_DENBC|nr:hypothetical protein K435DRAFT_663012 [Dendrothele bispora CBS 962.96]
MASTRRRPHTSAPGDGSRTITITNTPADEQHGDDAPEESSGEPSTRVVGSLKLRASNKKTRQRVGWSDDVVDNEGCGKKSSKICCIYHKPKPFDESSDEDDSDSECDHNHAHSHSHGHGAEGSGGTGLQARDGGSGVIHTLEESSDSDVNAYEAVPKPGKGKHRA